MATTSSLMAIANKSPFHPQMQQVLDRAKAEGAKPLPQVDLNTQVPSNPFVIPGRGFFDMVIYPQPVMDEKAKWSGKSAGPPQMLSVYA